MVDFSSIALLATLGAVLDAVGMKRLIASIDVIHCDVFTPRADHDRDHLVHLTP